MSSQWQKPFASVTFQLCCVKEWWDLSSTGQTRSWPSNGVAPSPYHRGAKSPLRDVHLAGDNPNFIKVDLANTLAIAGVSKDHLASTLVFVAVRCQHWGAGPFQVQLDRAFGSFSLWCAAHKKYTTIREFDKSELKITSLHDRKLAMCFRFCAQTF